MMRIAKCKKFTLVELLFIIMILSILMALLLPSLQKGMETARRAACMGILRQQHVGIANYTGDNHGMLPPKGTFLLNIGGTYIEEHGISTATRYYGDPDVNTNYRKLTANALFYKYEYWDGELFNCPSMDCRLTLLPAQNVVPAGNLTRGVLNPAAATTYQFGYTHYGYRFNFHHGQDDVRYSPRLFTSGKFATRALLWDQAAGVRDTTTYLPRPASIPYGMWTGYDVTRRMKWAHKQGGNIMRFDGAGVWLENQLSPVNNLEIILFTSWPAVSWSVTMLSPAMTRTLPGYGKVDSGIDFWMNR